MACRVTPANVGDREGIQPVLERTQARSARLKTVFVDSGYSGEPFATWAKTDLGLQVQVILRPDAGVKDGIGVLHTSTPTPEQFNRAVEIARKGQKGFWVLPKRWVVERTFAWLLTFRRLRLDYEELPVVSEGFLYLGMADILLRRLGN